MQSLVEDAGLQEEIVSESAGTHAAEGTPRDPRSRSTARSHGIELHGQSRRFEPNDFDDYEYVRALDHENLYSLQRLARTDEERRRGHLLRDFDPDSARASEVPDPYRGGPEGFEIAYQMIDSACRGLLDKVREGRGES